MTDEIILILPIQDKKAGYGSVILWEEQKIQGQTIDKTMVKAGGLVKNFKAEMG